MIQIVPKILYNLTKNPETLTLGSFTMLIPVSLTCSRLDLDALTQVLDGYIAHMKLLPSQLHALPGRLIVVING